MIVTTKLRPTETFKGTDLGDEYLFYDRENDRVHVLNGTAREIYLLFDGVRSQEEVARVVAEKYELEAKRAQDDVADAVTHLLDLGVLRTD